MLKNLIIFGTGVYAGVYIAQNYQIDDVESPYQLYLKVKQQIENKLEEMNACKKEVDPCKKK